MHCSNSDFLVVALKLHSLPSILSCQVSHCPLDSSAKALFLPLVACEHLATIKAADSGLKGHLPDVNMLSLVEVDGTLYSTWLSPLGSSLQVLDVSGNSILQVDSLPKSAQTVSLAMNPSVKFAEGVLSLAVKNVFLNLEGTKLLDTHEAENLLQAGEFNVTDSETTSDKTKGFQCKDIVNPSLAVTPHLFLPGKLCTCSAGWTGFGVDCKKCPVDTFKNETTGNCSRCPESSRAAVGSASIKDCQCSFGALFSKNGLSQCGCVRDHALLDGDCVKCEPFKLNCADDGSEAVSAKPLQGYSRLAPNQPQAYRCFPPKRRCNATPGGFRDELGCTAGYTGVLCSECMAKHRKEGQYCLPCPRHTEIHWSYWSVIALATVVLAAAIILAVLIWRMSAAAEPAQVAPSALGAARRLAASQAPILLQACQLWPMLAALAMTTGSKQGSNSNESNAMWEIPYVQSMQLSFEMLKDLKGVFNLQCQYDIGLQF